MNIQYQRVGFKTQIQQTKFHFAPGIIWKMNKNKFTLFGGFEAPVNLHGLFTLVRANYYNGQMSSDGATKTTLPKGYSLGIGALIGFNYSPAKWYSIGAEFSPSLLYARLSGKTKTVAPWLGPDTIVTRDEDKGFTFYEQRCSLNLSVWF